MKSKHQEVFRIVLHWLPKILKAVVPIASAFIGLKILEVFNVFDYIAPLKGTDKSFDVGVTVYFTIVDFILECFLKNIKQTVFVKQSLEIILSTSGSQKTVNSVPVLTLEDDRVAEATITVKIKAKRTTVERMIITLPAINFATIQHSGNSRAVTVDQNGNYQICLGQIVGSSLFIETEQSFSVLFLKEPVEGTSTWRLKPELNEYPILLDIVTNAMEIKTEVYNGNNKMAR